MVENRKTLIRFTSCTSSIDYNHAFDALFDMTKYKYDDVVCSFIKFTKRKVKESNSCSTTPLTCSVFISQFYYIIKYRAVKNNL